MSKNIKELAGRAAAGTLSKEDMAYLRSREGVPTFDAVRRTAEASEFVIDDEDDDVIASLTVAELKEELDALGVDYDSDDRKADLVMLLREAS